MAVKPAETVVSWVITPRWSFAPRIQTMGQRPPPKGERSGAWEDSQWGIRSHRCGLSTRDSFPGDANKQRWDHFRPWFRHQLCQRENKEPQQEQTSIHLGLKNCNMGSTDSDRYPNSIPTVGWKQGVFIRKRNRAIAWVEWKKKKCFSMMLTS